MKSILALPILLNLIGHVKDYKIRLVIATSIFQINEDPNMIAIAIDSFKMLDNKENAYYAYTLTDSFYYLASLKNEKVIKLIERVYQSSRISNFLIMPNAH